MSHRAPFAALAIVVIAAGCGPAAPPERDLRVLTRFPLRTPDPQASDDATTLTVLANVYEPLADLDAAGRLVPRLATSWANPNDLTWRFELRTDVRFHDGRPFTAEDVKATLDRGLARPESWIRASVPLLDEARAVSSHVVEITTRRPAPMLINQLAEVAILPRGVGAEGPFPGTGPYRIESWSADRARLVRYAAYAGAAPAWPAAEFRHEPDAGRRVRAIQAGEADLSEASSPAELRALPSGSARLVRHPSARIALLGFDVRARPGNAFHDPRVRRAVALSLDRRAILAEAQLGYGDPVTELAPPGVFGLPPGGLVPPADPAAARALLASTGAAGVSAPLLFASERNAAIAKVIVRQAAAAGITFEPAAQDLAEFDRTLMEGRAAAYIFLMTFPNRDASDLLSWGLHTHRPDLGYGLLNFAGYSDPSLDALLEEAETQLRPQRRAAVLQQAMRLARDANVWIPLCTIDALYAAAHDVEWPRSANGRVRLEEIGRRGPS